MTTTTREVQDFVAMVRTFAQRRIDDTALNGRSVLPSELTKGLSESGLLDLAVDSAEHDAASSLTWVIPALVEVSKASASLGFILAARHTAQLAILPLLGPDRARDVSFGRMSLSVAHGEHSEPGRINALSALVPLAAGAATITLIDPDTGLGIIADLNSPGLTTESAPQRSGLRGSGSVSVTLTDVEVPAARTLSAAAVSQTASRWYLCLSAISLGITTAALEQVHRYAEERRQFGSALADFAAIRAMVGEMATRVDATKAMVDHAVQSGSDSPAEAARTAAYAGRAAVDTCLEAIQIHGGYGYIEEYPVSRLLRDAISIRARGERRSLIRHSAADVFDAQRSTGAFNDQEKIR